MLVSGITSCIIYRLLYLKLLLRINASVVWCGVVGHVNPTILTDNARRILKCI